MKKMRDIKQSIEALRTREMVKLDAWLHTLIQGREAAMKERCKCAEGKLHGPYWYAYWSEGGKTRSQYIGKRLPKGVKPARDVKSRRVR